jgi:hypothetical protein
MKELYIWHHLGMGDHILCNGIVRHYAKLYDKIYLFVKKQFLLNIKFLYRDLVNIDFIDGSGDQDQNVYRYLDIHPGIPLLKISNNGKQPFDQAFYENAKIPFSEKWNSFYLERNLHREKEIYYDILGLKDDEEFIFVHDDERSRINETYLHKNIKIIKPNKEIGIFEFGYVFEKAKEIHLMNSSFLCLIDTMELSHSNLNYHTYVRPGAIFTLSKNLNWNIIDF